MPDYGARYTDKTINRVEKELHEVYSTAKKELEDKLDEFYQKHKARDRIKRKQLLNGEITQQEYQDWLSGQVFQREQWKRQIKQINHVLYDTNSQAVKIVNNRRLDVFAENYNYFAYLGEQNPGISFELYDARSVARLIRDHPQILPEWEIDEEKDYIWNAKKVNNIVTQGIIQGEGIGEIAQRLSRDLSSQNENKMLMFARTAITGAQNAGRQRCMEDTAGMGVETRKKWIATLDRRTRDSHRHLDGQEVAYDEDFESDHGAIKYPGDPEADPAEVFNCRCTMVEIFPKYEDRTKRDWREDEIIDGQTYAEWKQGKKRRGEVKPEEPVEPDGIDVIKEKIKAHTGDWNFNDLYEVGGLFEQEIEKQLATRRSEHETAIATYKGDYETYKEKTQELQKRINDLDAQKKYDEADLLEKELREYQAKKNDALSKELKEDREYKQICNTTVLETLKRIRPVGGVTSDNVKEHADLDAYNYKKKDTRERTIEALNYYPTAWLDISKNSSSKLKPHWTAGRAYYDWGEIRFNHRVATNTHELGHRFEHVIPGIKTAEKEFYEKRTAGEELKWLGDGYRRDEKTRRDSFADPYMGKEYGGTWYELVSMGFQYCYTDYNYFKEKDPEMVKWILGILAGI